MTAAAAGSGKGKSAGAGVTLFAGYYAAVQCIHRKDSAARANWHNPPTATALLAGALGGAAHAVVVQPLLLLQSGEVNPMLFRLTNENVNHAQCRFSDGRNTVVVPAIYEDEFILRCTAPDFSRYSVGLPHRVEVEVTLNRGAQWSSNR